MSNETMKDRTILIILLALVVIVACVIAIIVIYMMLGAFSLKIKKLTFAHGFRRKKNNDFPSTAINR
jgi:flagellar basal body-associated protein FliL